MNHQNPGGFQGWGGGGHQHSLPQQQLQQLSQNNPQLQQQFQQMQQQLLLQQQQQQQPSMQGGHSQMSGHMGMDQQNNRINFQQQMPSQPQVQQHMNSIHDQGASAQGMMNQNTWMQQAQQPSASTVQALPQNTMNMMGGGSHGNNNNNTEGLSSQTQQQSQQQQQAALYWNMLQSQQSGGNQGFSMAQQQQQPQLNQQQPNLQQFQSQHQLQQMQQQQNLQQPNTNLQQQMQQMQQPNQNQGMISGGMMSGITQVGMNNEGGMINNNSNTQSQMGVNNQQQQLQQLFAMQQKNVQLGQNNRSVPSVASSGQLQQQLQFQQSQGGQQHQLQQGQQPLQDKSSSSSQQRNQAQLLLQQQNLISQLQQRIQQQRQPQSSSSDPPAASAPVSSQSNNFVGGLGWNSQQDTAMYGSQGQNSQLQPRGNVNTNEQLLMSLTQQQQSQLQSDGLRSQSNAANIQGLQQQNVLQQYSQQQQTNPVGFQRDTSGMPGQQQQQQQQQQLELMLQQQQQNIRNNDANQQRHQYQRNPTTQQQNPYDMNQNKAINNEDFASFSTQFSPNNNMMMSPSVSSINSQHESRQAATGPTFSQQPSTGTNFTQQVGRQTSAAAATPGTAINLAGDVHGVGKNQSQQQQPSQQLMNTQLPQGIATVGAVQGAKKDGVASVNGSVPGTSGGASTATGEDTQDEPSLDQRVKQFELMQQQQMSKMRQQNFSGSRSLSIGDASVASQPPPGVDDRPSGNGKIDVQEPKQLVQEPQQQPQQQQLPLQQPDEDKNLTSITVESFTGKDDVSESLEVSEPQHSLLPVRAGTPGSLGVAEPDPIVDGATIIRSEGAINIIAPARHGSTGGGDASDEPGANTSSIGVENGESGSEQPFLDGHFAGGWQSNADLPDRRQIIFSIIKVIERKRPDTNRMSQNRLPLMAKKLEEHLYRSAHLKNAYVDLASLKKRLHLIAKGVGIPKSTTPSDSSIGTNPSVVFTTSPRGNYAQGTGPTPMSVVNSLQPVVATSQGSIKPLSTNLGTARSNFPEEMESDEPLPSSKKEQAQEYPRPRADSNEISQSDKIAANGKKKNNGVEVDKLDNDFGVSPMETDRDDISSKRKVILQQQQRRLLLLRHASKCTEGLLCRVKFCPQMVTLWKHMKTCRDKNCKAPHCLSSRCVLNHYRICKSEGLTSTCEICAPVMKHIRTKESSSESQDPEVLNRMGGLSDAENYDELPVGGESDEQDTSDSFKALKEALVSELPNDTTDEMAICKPVNSSDQSQQQRVDQPDQNKDFQSTSSSSQNKQNTSQLSVQQSQQLQAQQSSTANSHNQDGKRTADDVGNEDSRPNKVLKRNSSTTSVAASDGSGGGGITAKKSSSLITSMAVSDIEAHLDSLVSGRLTPRQLSQRCLPIVKKLSEHENGWVFNEPVDPVELGIHDYFDVIEHPMDLDLVTKKLENGVYLDLASFRKDTRLVFENAILYNGKESDVGMMAKQLLDMFEDDLSRSFKGLSVLEESKKADCCSLCGNHRRLYELPSLFCSGTCGRNIRRNANYFTDRMKQNQWCEACHVNLKDDEPLLLDNGKETKKAFLQQMKNDKSPEEKWVQCDKCQEWVHQVCALFNGTQNYKSASFTCPKCYVKCEEVSRPSVGPKGAADLPHCKLSEAIENGIAETLSKEYEKVAKDRDCSVANVEKAENLFIRVVSNVEKKQKVREGMKTRYSKDNYPSEFPVRSKCILLFQKIHGIDVLLFAMYVYEYGDKCPAPNRRRVYISYLDSVRYLTPAQYRTAIYQSVLIEYLRFVKMRGFHTAHIWSCPPAKGDEYIFYCHPSNQLTPRNDMLCAWYNDALEKAKSAGVALEIRTLYDDYFKDNVVNRKTGEPFDPTSIPYFDGDYVPGEIEKIIKDLDEDDNRREGTKLKDTPKAATAQSKTEGNRSGTRSNPGRLVNQGRDKVMNRLDLIMSRMKENFFVVQLLSNDFIDSVEGDTDITSWVESSVPGDDSEKSTRTIGKNPYLLDVSDKKVAEANQIGGTDFPFCQQTIAVTTDDKDPSMEQECFETRLQFLNYCQRNNYQFDELRRAKYSSTMVLAYLHNPREEKEQLIKGHLEVIAHAATCSGCVSKNCQRMKQLFEHVRSCELTYKRGCKVCTRLFMLLIKHARDCPIDGACPIPFCERIKERNKMLLKQQQLMDDRRRNAQNNRAKEDST